MSKGEVMSTYRPNEKKLQGIIDELYMRHAAIDQTEEPDMEASELKVAIRYLNNGKEWLRSANEVREARKGEDDV